MSLSLSTDDSLEPRWIRSCRSKLSSIIDQSISRSSIIDHRSIVADRLIDEQSVYFYIFSLFKNIDLSIISKIFFKLRAGSLLCFAHGSFNLPRGCRSVSFCESTRACVKFKDTRICCGVRHCILRMVRGCPYCTPDSGRPVRRRQLGVSRIGHLFYSTRITIATFFRAIN